MVKPKNMLRKKLCRDMSRAAMQFLSIIALCALGTFAFSALDGMARMIRTTLNTYYEENNLADFWITLPTADRASMEKLAALPDVEAVCARASVDLDTTLPGDVSVSVTVYDGEMTINSRCCAKARCLRPTTRAAASSRSASRNQRGFRWATG